MGTASSTLTSHQVNDLVLQEQIALTCQQLGVMAASSIIADGLVAYLFYGKVPTSALLLWLGTAVIGVSFVLIALYIAARKRHWRFQHTKKWTALLTIIAFASGAAWGSAGLLLFIPGSIVDQQFLLILLLAGTSLIMVMMAAYPPAFYAAMIPMLLPITFRLLTANDSTSTVLGIIPIVYGATLAYFYNSVHQTLLESLRLRFALAETAEALAEQKTEAEQANLAKSRFLAAASHDLRQPLHAQGLFVGELQARIHNEENKRILTNLKDSMEAMHELFNSLLDISRLDASVVEPKQENFSINVLLRELHLDFSPLANEKGLVFRITHSRAVVNSDPALLKRIIRNMVSNAIRYTHQGKVLVGCRRHADQLRIQIWDTGIGIHKADQQSIFEEFHQLHHSERDRRTGLGLGLAIANRLATLMRHPIEVRSQVGKGSMFSVAVPFVGTVTNDVSPPSLIVNRDGDLSGHIILVIDDEPVILRGMKGLLEQWGCQVLAAESVAQAVAYVQAPMPCLAAIIADYRLRNHETGVEAIACIRALLKKEVPGFLITGDTAPERLQEAYASGYQILHKPVPPARLRALLGHIIRTTPPTAVNEENISLTHPPH